MLQGNKANLGDLLKTNKTEAKSNDSGKVNAGHSFSKILFSSPVGISLIELQVLYKCGITKVDFDHSMKNIAYHS